MTFGLALVMLGKHVIEKERNFGPHILKLGFKTFWLEQIA